MVPALLLIPFEGILGFAGITINFQTQLIDIGARGAGAVLFTLLARVNKRRMPESPDETPSMGTVQS